MFRIGLHTSCFFWLLFVRMQFSVSQKHRLLFVLVEVREGVVSLGVIETKHHQRERANEMLLKWKLSELRCLKRTLASEQVVLAFIELFFDVALKHL